MDSMTTFQIITLLLSAAAILFTLFNTVTGRKKDSTENADMIRARAREEGKQEQNVLNAIENLSKKVDDLVKNQFTKEQFEEAKKNFVTREEFAEIVQRAKSNTHRLDELEGVRHGDR